MTKKEELLETRNYLLRVNNYVKEHISSKQRLIEYYEYSILNNTNEVFDYMYEKLREQANNVNIKKLSTFLYINNNISINNGEQALDILKELPYYKYIYQVSINDSEKLININDLKLKAEKENLDIKFYTRYSSLEQSLDSDAIFGSVGLGTILPTNTLDDTKIYNIKRK